MAVGDLWYFNINWNPPVGLPLGSIEWDNVNGGSTYSTIAYGVTLSGNIETNSTVPTTPYTWAASGNLYFDSARTISSYLFISRDFTLYGPVPSSSTVPTDIVGTVGTLVFATNNFDHTYAGYFQVSDYPMFKNQQVIFAAASGTSISAPFVQQ